MKTDKRQESVEECGSPKPWLKVYVVSATPEYLGEKNKAVPLVLKSLYCYVRRYQTGPSNKLGPGCQIQSDGDREADHLLEIITSGV